MISYRAIAQIFEDLEAALFASLKRNLSSHIEQEKQMGFDWSAWQAEKLRNLGKFHEKNEKLLGEYLPEIEGETRQLLEEQYSEGERRAEKEIEALKVENAPPVSASAGGFHGVNEPRLEKLIEDTQQLEHTAESAALRMMDDVYRTTLHRAEIAMASGSVTLPQAIDMSVKEFLRKGINCIEYKDGRRVNIADYAEMALRTAATRSQLQGLSDRFNAMGYDTVLVTEYGQCSDTCLPWQGRVYINDVWGQFPLPDQPNRSGKTSADGANTLDNSGKSDIIEDEEYRIGRSVGAKASNYNVKDLSTGEIFHFAEGTHLDNVTVFAGKGTKIKFRKAEKYAEKHGGNPEDWQHVKGRGTINYYGEERNAEVHWVQCDKIGKYEFFIKEWLE